MLMIFLWTQHVLGGEAIRPVGDRAIVETASSLFLHGVLAPPTTRRSEGRPRRAPRTPGRRIRRRPAP
jgi:hypothetical protein